MPHYRKAYASLTAGVEYVEIPKSACTAIKAALLATDGWEVNDGGHAHCHQAFERIPAEWKPKLRFTFVRHPLDRLVSCYCEKLQRDLARRLVGRCPLPPDAPFVDWALWVCSQPVRGCDRHWAPAVEILRRRGGSLDPPVVYRWEGLAHYWDEVLRPVYGLATLDSPDPSVVNRSPGKRPWTSYYCPRSIAAAANFYADDLERWEYQLPQA